MRDQLHATLPRPARTNARPALRRRLGTPPRGPHRDRPLRLFGCATMSCQTSGCPARLNSRLYNWRATKNDCKTA
jgi:hypothetical protein